MNRALDKPAEHEQVTGADGGQLVILWQRADDEAGTLEHGSSVQDLVWGPGSRNSAANSASAANSLASSV
jgi:hypothetical protein